MKWFATSFATLAAVEQVLAMLNPTAPATPCVPSRSVDAAVQSGISLGCQEVLDTTEAVVCSDYLAQEILTATSYFCGNQTEAFNHCNNLPDVSVSDCQGFDPTGGGLSPDCAQEALNAYNICGNDTGSGLFASGDPVSLSQCLYYDLSLCTPEDGEGHFNAVFTGAQTDCPIPSYTPACGVYPTSSSAPTTTAPLASSMSSPPSSSPSSLLSSSTPPSFSSAAPSSHLTEAGSPVSDATTSTPKTAPTAPTRPPNDASPLFHLIINGTFTQFVSVTGGLTSDSGQAQVFYILNGQLLTPDGLRVQAGQGGSPGEPNPYVPFVASADTLPFSVGFALATAGINPSITAEKRQAVGLTTLSWTNAAFATPGTTAEFCIYDHEVYAILRSTGLSADIFTLCVPVALNAIYIPLPQPASSSISVPATSTATSPITPSGAASAAATTLLASTRLFPTITCPAGQTAFAYTTIPRLSRA